MKEIAAFSRAPKPYSAPGIHKRAEIRSDLKGKIKRGHRGARTIGGKNMELSIETKVAIAVATGFVVLIVGAIAQG